MSTCLFGISLIFIERFNENLAIISQHKFSFFVVVFLGIDVLWGFFGGLFYCYCCFVLFFSIYFLYRFNLEWLDLKCTVARQALFTVFKITHFLTWQKCIHLVSEGLVLWDTAHFINLRDFITFLIIYLRTEYLTWKILDSAFPNWRTMKPTWGVISTTRSRNLTQIFSWTQLGSKPRLPENGSRSHFLVLTKF